MIRHLPIMRGKVSSSKAFLCLEDFQWWGFLHLCFVSLEVFSILQERWVQCLIIRLAATLQSTRSSFDRNATILRWSLTNGLRFFLQFWFAKRPLFWLPRGLVPGYVEWLLSFPRAPRGSVSIQVWGLACSTVLQLVGSALAVVWVLVMTRGTRETKRVREEGIQQEGRGIDKKEL